MENDRNTLPLCTIRQNRGISLQQISESTKISVRLLEAIENCDFYKLPGGIYNTSYIRQYARAIDYDESQILDVYHRMMSGSDNGVPRKTPGKGSVGDFRQAEDIAS
jgi:cytoskeletal protein RodZ